MSCHPIIEAAIMTSRDSHVTEEIVERVVQEFWCPDDDEALARTLTDAGFDGDLDCLCEVVRTAIDEERWEIAIRAAIGMYIQKTEGRS